ncbi:MULTISPECIES: branched-chain amino acid aminotransferase [unclassified Streptomyces]|uniref:branched-chain amino acid aminotransferase n=1 Tax=unclassified Streptomyces TaxID=2593676 RepID=UPI00278C08F2|nr:MULTISPECIES: branched-chain amino acid aminotransferase [unclassified Streptomyces]
MSQSLEFSQARVTGVPDAERERVLAAPVFGEVCTDHMVTIKWSRERGWHDAHLGAYGPLSLDPTTQVFHYGQEIFEGLKAYRREDGSIVSFRPDANAARLNTSAARMAMPELPEETFLEALRLLLDADRDWVPEGEGKSLYLRPFMIATQPSLGFFRPSDSYLFVVVASPAASYFKGGVTPVTVWVGGDYTRAADGGTGAAKCGGNYAGTLVAQEQAARQGCDQVVWLDAKERRWIDEMGTSNMFFVYGDRLVTPELTGTLLAGITRDSVLTLARDLGLTAEEGRISVEQWRADAESGRLTEVFSCGTSSMITPVGRAKSEQGEWLMGDGTPGKTTLRLREELMGLQSGERPDRHGWIQKMA